MFSKILVMIKYFGFGVHVIYSTVYVAMFLVHFNRFVQFSVGYSGSLIALRDTLDLFCFIQRVVYPREL